MTLDQQMRRAAAGRGGFNPETDITWHSLFWAEGTDFVAEGYSDTDPVDTWPNETGESDLTQATGSLQPAYVLSESSLNNQPAVDFVAAADYMQTAAFAADPTATYQIIAITKSDSTSGLNALVDTASAPAAEGYIKNGAWGIYASGAVQEAGTADTNAHLVIWEFGGSGNERILVDGVIIVDADAGSATHSDLSVGAELGGTNGWAGPTALVGIYDGDITEDDEYDNFTAWVETHYGITEATPFLGAPFGWEHAYDAAGPNMSSTYSDGDPVTGPWLDEVQSFNPARSGGGTITYKAAPPTGSGFFDTISMENEFWAEDPSWTNPGDGNDMVSWRNNGTDATDATAGRRNPTDNYPTFVASSTINSRPAIRFNNSAASTGGRMDVATEMSVPHTLVVVAKSDISPLAGTRYMIAAATTRGQIYGTSAGDVWGSRNNDLVITGGTTDTDAHLHVAKFLTNDAEQFLDGVSIGTDTVGTPNDSGNFKIGTYTDATGYWDGDIAYVAQYSGDLTAHADYETFIDNLMTYYGIRSEGIGGRPSLDFDGTGYFTGNVGADIAQPHSVVSVVELDGTGDQRISSGTAPSNRHRQDVTGTNWALRAPTLLSDGAADTNAHVLVTVASGTSSLVRVDGVTAVVGDAGADPFRPGSFGADYTGINAVNGRIAALGVYDGDITTEAGFADWEADVMTHYGITLPTDGGFFGSISMQREFWAEDPSWTNPGDGVGLTTWRDNGSFASDVTPTTSGTGSAPHYASSGIGGKPTIRFTATSRSNGGGLFATGDDAGSSVTVVVIAKADALGWSRQFLTGAYADPGDGMNLAIDSTPQYYIWNTNALTGVGGTSDTDPHVFVAVFNNTPERSLYVDGATISLTGTETTYNSPSGISLGMTPAGDDFFLDGDISYVAQYGGDLTAHADYDEYIHNLRTYYGI